MPNTGMKMMAMIQAIAVDGLRLAEIMDRRDQDDQDVGNQQQPADQHRLRHRAPQDALMIS